MVPFCMRDHFSYLLQGKKRKTWDIRFISKTANIWDWGQEASCLFFLSWFSTSTQTNIFLTVHEWLQSLQLCMHVCLFECLCVSVPKAIFCKAAVCCELVKVAGQLSTSVSCSSLYEVQRRKCTVEDFMDVRRSLNYSVLIKPHLQ